MPQSQKKNVSPERRYRPLGMIIAILAVALVYGIFPLVPFFLTALVTLQGHYMSGADLPFSSLDVTVGLLILVICVLAWIGRPRGIRWVLILSVWLATAYQLKGVLQSLQPASISQGFSGGSIGDLSRTVVPCLIIMLIIIPLYITWYMNRAPARAFYRHE